MRRREFITLLGGTVAMWPLTARAQQAKKPTIGFFIPTTRAPSSVWVAAFVQRLRELGWSEGGTVTIEYRWADGREERFAAILDEFVRMKVDLIATFGTAPVLAAKRATAEIPIVFALGADPVGTGLVTSLARPGGNVTGMSTQHNDLVGKRIELLREVVPDLRKLAIMGDVSTAELQDVEAAARGAGLDVVRLELRRAEDIAPSFGMAKGQAQALYVVTTPLTQTARVQIAALVLETRLPSVHGTQNYVESGGLMSYGPNFSELFRRAAEHVDRILRGAKPSNIPIEQPTKFDLVINLKTAKALGVTVPQTLQARANEVIE